MSDQIAVLGHIAAQKNLERVSYSHVCCSTVRYSSAKGRPAAHCLCHSSIGELTFTLRSDAARLLSGMARVRRLWLADERIALIHRRVRHACILLTLSATLQHSQQVVCLGHWRLLGSLLHGSIPKSSNGQKSLELF